jgi:hypothetical protein
MSMKDQKKTWNSPTLKFEVDFFRYVIFNWFLKKTDVKLIILVVWSIGFSP